MSALTLTETKGEPRVDSRLLASELRNQHKAVIAMVDRYAVKFTGFGVVPFEMEKPPGVAGGRPERVALLNEDQCYLLLSLSRNSDHVVDLKAKLVASFKEARAGRHSNSVEYLPGYHNLHDKMHELSAASSNQRAVHMNINKLVNKTVGIGSGERSSLEVSSKAAVIVAQQIAARALETAEDHRDGYQKAKQALAPLGQALLGLKS